MQPIKADKTEKEFRKKYQQSEEKSIHPLVINGKPARENVPPIELFWIKAKRWFIGVAFPEVAEYVDSKIDLAIKTIVIETVKKFWVYILLAIAFILFWILH